jgi:hypothetical protein
MKESFLFANQNGFEISQDMQRRRSNNDKGSRWEEIASSITDEWKRSKKSKTLEALLKKPKNTFISPQAAKKALIDNEKTNQEAIDLACKHFAKSGKWPRLKPGQLLLLSLRLKEALDFLGMLMLQQVIPQPDLQISNSALLDFLLIDYWHKIGRERYLGRTTLHL